ncbi:hypothetical protein B566_EDAN013016, partial [Ephemera danica]
MEFLSLILVLIILLLMKKGFSKPKNYPPGVFYNDGPEWREQRRFTLRHLRDFGFGRRSMEIYIHEEARTLFETMENEDFDLLDLLPILFIRLLWAIVAGNVAKQEDPKFCKFIDVVLACFRENDATFTTFFVPELRYIPFVNAPYNRLIRNLSEMKSYVE